MQKDQKNKKEWKSIVELFEAMNESLEYCVLRNTEDVTIDFSPEIHGDIDILVKDKEKAKQIMGLSKVYNESYRAIHETVVAGKPLRIDLKYVGDNYYCRNWEYALLKSSHIINQDGIRIKVPSPICQYYSLLYHVYLQKTKIAEDYPKKIKSLAMKAGVAYKDDIKFLMKELEDYMNRNGFRYVFPNDINMPINWENLSYFRNYNHIRFIERLRPNIVVFRFLKFIDKITRKFCKVLHL